MTSPHRSSRTILRCVRLLAPLAVVGAWLAAAAPAAAQLGPAPTSSWHTNGAVKAITQLNGIVYLAGTFSTVSDSSGQTVRRANLAAIDLATGQVTGWNPGTNGPVLSITSDGSGTIYAGGPFTVVQGLSRTGLVAISAAGAVLPWQGQVSGGDVHALRYVPGRLYVGGGYSWIDGVNRPNLAAVDPITGELLAWNPRPDGIVWAVRVINGEVFVGGGFQYMGTSRQSHLAALSPTTGRPLPWLWYPYRAAVLSLTTSDGLLVAGLAGNGGRVVAIDLRTHRVAWTRWLDGNVKAVAIADGEVIVGGHFMNLCAAGSGEPCVHPAPAHHLTAVDLRTGAPTAWHPSVDGVLGVYTLFGGVNTVTVGGSFTTVAGVSQPYYAQFAASG